MQDELRGAKTHDDGHTPCSNLRPHRASTTQVNAVCKKTSKWVRWRAKPKRALFPRSHGSSAKSECHKLPPELNKSASGSQCREVSVSTQGAEFARSGGKGLPFWQETPDAGTKLQVQSLPPCARCLRRAGSRAHQVSGQTPDASATLDGALFNKAHIIDSLSRCMEMQTWKRAAGQSLSSGMEKGINTDFCQESQVSAEQRGKLHGCTCAGHSCLWSHQRTSLACGWIYSQPIFLCSLRPENLDHQEA